MKKKIFFSIIILALILASVYWLFWRSGEKAVKEIQINQNNSDNPTLENIVPAKTNAAPDEQKETKVQEENKIPEEKKVLEETKIFEESAVKNESGPLKIINNLVGWGYEKANSRKIDTIVIHSTYNATGGDEYSLDKILDIYKSYGVSPHYIITRGGKVYRLVEEKNIAYHAGESKVPDGRTSVNDFSIGIEMINSKSEGPSSAQYSSLKNLIANLKDKYKIKYTLGHSDIAPGRKDDPWKFDWNKIK